MTEETISEETRRTFHDSLDRCTRHPRFWDIFYEKLQDASPEDAFLIGGL